MEGIIGILLAVVGLVLTIVGLVLTKRSRREKKLVYEVMSPVPVADVLQGKSAYSVRVVYEQPNAAPSYVDHAFTQFLRFTNFGRVPITKPDLAVGDSLRIEITGGNVLAATLVSETRNACKIVLHPLETDVNEDVTTIHLEFDFLDYLDGGIIQILTGSEHFRTSLLGTVIGMPDGITKIEIPERTELPQWGCALVIVSFLVAFGASFWAFKYITGEWVHSWVMLLPLASLMVPLGCLILLTYLLEPRKKFEFPEPLFPPQWYTMRRYAESRFTTPEYIRSRSKLKKRASSKT
jgi:hypothetical protein